MSKRSDPSSQLEFRLVIHFTHLRPYHLARIRSAEDAFAGSGTRVYGLALIDSTGPLPPELPISRPNQTPIILFPESPSLPTSSRRISREVFRVLDQLRPTTVAICGYATPDARACLRWCRRHKAKAILMTETREQDMPRTWWKEWIKSRVVRSFEGALCGGPEARAYLEKLGMPPDRIAEGYDVVDNEYFARESDRIRAEEGDKGQETGDWEHAANSSSQLSAFPLSAFTPKYFLASNRFIPRKNVSALIDAYALYLKSCPLSGVTEQKSADSAPNSKIENHQSSIVNQSPPWNLCLLGDGELKSSLIAQCLHLGLQVIEKAPWEVSSSPRTTDNRQPTTPPSPTVFFPGWRTHAELPRFYAHAGAFVHPAISEPWGLVVNEAMASALPVLISPGTGAAISLAGAGTDGVWFNPASPGIAARHLNDLAIRSDEPNQAAAKASRSRVQEHASSSAFGMGLALLTASR